MRGFFKGYESKHQPLVNRIEFAKRIVSNMGAALVLIGISLVGGMCGYHYLEGLSWIDAFADASMILSGMGPLSTLKTSSGKIFAGCYALYSGLLLVLTTGLIFGPVVHRMMLRFHMEEDEDPEADADSAGKEKRRPSKR